MRTAFIQTVSQLAARDKTVWLVTGDLGFSVFEDFIARFPRQFLNVGVAEQDLIGVAAGLALAGKKVFAYSISTFATLKPYEQIRNDICYQDLPVCIVGGGSTFSYSTFGCTHFPLEDLGIVRLLPNMAVVCPGDPFEVRALLRDIYRRNQPAYIRIAKKGEPVVHRSGDTVRLGKISVMRRGGDATVIVAGRLLPTALEAATILRKQGIHCRVLSCHTLKPIDRVAIVKAAKETSLIVTCEEHSLIGGLRTVVSEVLNETGRRIPFISRGVPDEFPKGVGSQEYFLERYGLTAASIAKAVRLGLRKARRSR